MRIDPSPLASFSETQRIEAMQRFAVLRPHLEEGATLTAAAKETGVPLRTASSLVSFASMITAGANSVGRRKSGAWSNPSMRSARPVFR